MMTTSSFAPRLAVIHFWASWSEPCQQMQEAMIDLAKEHSDVKFYKVGPLPGPWEA